jgi:hypothetical protein
MAHANQNTKDTSDPRSKSTLIIWGCATGMFALCIPLVALTRVAVILPLAIALGAGASTVVIWRSDPRFKQRLKDEHIVRSLEERIANLEAIASHGELDLQRQFKSLELED